MGQKRSSFRLENIETHKRKVKRKEVSRSENSVGKNGRQTVESPSDTRTRVSNAQSSSGSVRRGSSGASRTSSARDIVARAAADRVAQKQGGSATRTSSGSAAAGRVSVGSTSTRSRTTGQRTSGQRTTASSAASVSRSSSSTASTGRVTTKSRGTSSASSASQRKTAVTQNSKSKSAGSNAKTSKSKTTPKANNTQKGNTDMKIWIAIAVSFLTLIALLSMVSYLMYWKQDADVAYFSKYFDSDLPDAANWAGRFGASLADALIGGWMGVAAFFMPVYLIILAVQLVSPKRLRVRRVKTSLVAIAIVLSVALGHFLGYNPEVFGSGWGGRSGIYIAQTLHSYIGVAGTSLLIVFLSIAILYYAFGRTITRLVTLLAAHLKGMAQRRKIRNELKRQQLIEQENKRRQKVLEMQEQRRDAQRLQNENSINAESSECEGVRGDESLRQLSNTPNQMGSENFGSENLGTETMQNNTSQTTGEFSVPVKGAGCNSSLIKLDNGQWGYFTHYDELGNPFYFYFDLTALSSAELLTNESSSAAGAHKNDTPQNNNLNIDSNTMRTTKTPPTLEAENEPQENEMQVVIREETQQTTETQQQSTDDTSVPFIVETPEQEPMAIKNVVSESQQKVNTQEETPKNGVSFEIEKAEEEQKVDKTEINTTKLYDPTAELSSYRKPIVELLQNHTQSVVVTKEELEDNKNRIEHTLSTFGIKIDTIKATVGPTVTLYEIIPAAGVRISKIKNLEDDIALSLSALGIRIIAPIPGKGTIGIEVPNTNKETVSMSSVICSAKFQDVKAELPIALGKTIQNETFVFDLAKMPHLLVAGATGQGKSVGLNAIITSLLYKKHPSELKFVLVDPKKVELTLYAKLEKHFLAKMECEEEAIITDTQKVVYTLNSLCKEMDARYDLLKMAEVRNIVEYNNKFIHRRLLPTKGHRYLPYFVVIIDEFADLIMTAGREIETPIARIAQLARAVGIHLIIATQRPTTNIITGVIKANFPARIAFRVTSMIDSRTILDTPGANQLIGRGDMLVSTGSELTRVQCAFIDTPEVDDITRFISQQRGYLTAYELPEYVPESESGGAKEVDMSRKDPLFEEVARHVVSTQTGSASTIQRKFSIGFNRAGRIVDQLEAAGIVGAQSGSKPREVLIKDPMTLEMMLED